MADIKSFLNPYNFVSISEEVRRKSNEDWRKNGSLTGYIDCKLQTLSPVFIPNTSNKNAFVQEGTLHEEVKSYDFFSYKDLTGLDCRTTYNRPIIPGSSLRGVIRSAYETLVNGCLSSVDDENGDNDLLYRRTEVRACKSPGVLDCSTDAVGNKVWSLYQAERVMLRIGDCHSDPEGILTRKTDYKDGELVYIQKSSYTYITSRHFDTHLHTVHQIARTRFSESDAKGYVLHGQTMIGKHHDSVMVIRTGPAPKPVSKMDILRLKRVVEIYGDDKINKTNDGYPQYKSLLDAALHNPVTTRIPVFYTILGNGTLYLSPACITKEVFQNTVRSMLSTTGHQPCNTKSNICDACSMFGMIGADNEEAVTTRIRFGDAIPVLKENQQESSVNWKSWYEDVRCLPELSNPKTNSTEFYAEPLLNQRGHLKSLNYDYYQLNTNGAIAQAHSPQLRLRGRKYYWHSKEPNLQTGAITERNTFVRPVAKDKTFGMRIFFDKISKAELNKLLWALTFGSEDYAHKIGHGKPVGLGSVQLIPTTVVTRTLAIKAGRIQYKLEPFAFDLREIEVGAREWTETQSVKEFKRIHSIKDGELAAKVSYPISNDGVETYKWFVANRNNKFEQFLPKITDTNILLLVNRTNPAQGPNQGHGGPNPGHGPNQGNSGPNQGHRGSPTNHPQGNNGNGPMGQNPRPNDHPNPRPNNQENAGFTNHGSFDALKKLGEKKDE